MSESWALIQVICLYESDADVSFLDRVKAWLPLVILLQLVTIFKSLTADWMLIVTVIAVISSLIYD